MKVILEEWNNIFKPISASVYVEGLTFCVYSMIFYLGIGFSESKILIKAPTWCSEGWEEVNGRCWLLRNKRMNKKAAKTWCFHKGATLVEISSQTDQNSLVQFLDDAGFGTKATSTIWIPINDGKSEGNFKIDNTCTKKGKSQAAINSCLDATYTNFSTDSDNINDSTKNSVYYSVRNSSLDGASESKYVFSMSLNRGIMQLEMQQPSSFVKKESLNQHLHQQLQ